MAASVERVEGASEPPTTGPARRDRSRRWFVVAGGFGLGAAALVYLVGPGYVGGADWSSTVFVWVGVGLGIAFVVAAVVPPAVPFAPRRLARPSGAPRHHRERAAGIALAIATAVLLVGVVGAAGALPGWYLPSGGRTTLPIAGCAGATGATTAFSGYPHGFSPADLVDLRWSASNATEVTIAVEETPTYGGSPAGSWSEAGTYGQFIFYGSGGPITIRAAAQNATCPHAQSVDVRWTYTAAL